MHIYAKYSSRDNIVREISKSRSLCKNNLESFYLATLSEVIVMFTFTTILLPICVTLIVFSIFRGAHDTVTKNLVKPERHPHLVGMAMTGLTFSITIFVHDVIASYRIVYDFDQFRSYVSGYTPHFAFIHATTAIGFFFVLTQLLIWIYYIYCALMQYLGWRRKFTFPRKLGSVVSAIVGKKNSVYIRRLSDNDIIAFTILYMLIPPTFLATAHIGFIVHAWLVDPNRATITLLLFYASTGYLYIAFKKVYEIHGNVSFSTRRQTLGEAEEGGKEVIPQLPPAGQKTGDKSDGDMEKKSSYKLCIECYINFGVETNHLNVQALVIDLLYSVLIVSFAAIALAIFVAIPTATESIFAYFTNIFQLMVILVTAQISINVLFAVQFSFENFLDIFRNRLATKEETKLNSAMVCVARNEEASTTEVAGVLAADIADTFMNESKEE